MVCIQNVLLYQQSSFLEKHLTYLFFEIITWPSIRKVTWKGKKHYCIFYNCMAILALQIGNTPLTSSL